jgi:hypothetical protein
MFGSTLGSQPIVSGPDDHCVAVSLHGSLKFRILCELDTSISRALALK